jgi:hypothetical protein
MKSVAELSGLRKMTEEWQTDMCRIRSEDFSVISTEERLYKAEP